MNNNKIVKISGIISNIAKDLLNINENAKVNNKIKDIKWLKDSQTQTNTKSPL